MGRDLESLISGRKDGKMDKEKYLYRCVDYIEGYDTIRFPIIKETQCGYWIEIREYVSPNKRKFVFKDRKNSFAFPTIEKALINYYYRKKRQIEILTERLTYAKDLLGHVKKTMGIDVYMTGEEP